MNSDSRLKNLTKHVTVIGIGTVLTKMISFLLIPFYTRWMTTGEYGLFDLAASYIALLVPVITLQLDQAIYRFSMDDGGAAKRVFTLSMFLMGAFSIAVTAVVYMILGVVMRAGYVSEFILYYLSFALYSCCSEYLRGTDRLKQYSVFNVLVGLMMTAGSVLYVPILHMGTKGLLLAFATAYGVAALLILILYRPFSPKAVMRHADNGELIRIMLRYSGPLIPNSVSWWVTNVSDRTLITAVLGSAANGVYAISGKVPTVLNLLFGVFNLSFQHVAIRAADDRDRHAFFSDMLKKLVRFLISNGMLLVACLPFLYRTFLAESYWDGLGYVPILIAASVFLCMAQYLGGISLADKNTRVIGLSTVIAAVVNLGANLLFIGRFGLVFAACSTLGAYVIMFGIRYVHQWKTLGSARQVLEIAVFFALYAAVSWVSVGHPDDAAVQTWCFLISLAFSIIVNREVLVGIVGRSFSRFRREAADENQ